MALFLVSYDLRRPVGDYPTLQETLTKAGGVRILQSNWLVPSYSTDPKPTYAIASQGLDPDDRLAVVEVHNNSLWRSLMASDNTLLQIFIDFAR